MTTDEEDGRTGDDDSNLAYEEERDRTYEEDRLRYFARAAGNVLLVLAAVVGIGGGVVVTILVKEIGYGFPFEQGVDFTVYAGTAVNFGVPVVIAASVLAIGGLYFRSLELRQDVRAAELEALLDAIAAIGGDES
ncbi:MAG: hypothetical protein ACR2HN_02890 [Tepidiformaceae bacterium]